MNAHSRAIFRRLKVLGSSFLFLLPECGKKHAFHDGTGMWSVGRCGKYVPSWFWTVQRCKSSFSSDMGVDPLENDG